MILQNLQLKCSCWICRPTQNLSYKPSIFQQPFYHLSSAIGNIISSLITRLPFLLGLHVNLQINRNPTCFTYLQTTYPGLSHSWLSNFIIQYLIGFILDGMLLENNIILCLIRDRMRWDYVIIDQKPFC